MKKVAICTVAVLGLVFAGSSSLEAGHRDHGHHRSDHRHSTHRHHNHRNTRSNFRRYGWHPNRSSSSISFSNGNFGFSYDFGSSRRRSSRYNSFYGSPMHDYGYTPGYGNFRRGGRCGY